MDDTDDNHPSSDDDDSSDEYNSSETDSDSSLLLDKIYFSDNVFDDYFYEDMEYATDDEQAPYRNTRSHQNAATSTSTMSHASPNPAPEKRSHGHLGRIDKIPNKRRRTGGHLPPKKPKNDKGEGKGKPNSTSPDLSLPPDVPTASPATPGPLVQSVITPVMPDFQVPEESTSWEREMIGMYVHAIYLSLHG